MAVDAIRSDQLPDDVETAAARLGRAIEQMPAHEAFEEARTAVAEDPDLQHRIQEFESLREQFYQDRQTGDATQEDVATLRAAQRELHADPVMAEYLDAKDRLQEQLEAINQRISAPLATDFSAEAGGCCQD